MFYKSQKVFPVIESIGLKSTWGSEIGYFLYEPIYWRRGKGPGKKYGNEFSWRSYFCKFEKFLWYRSECMACDVAAFGPEVSWFCISRLNLTGTRYEPCCFNSQTTTEVALLERYFSNFNQCKKSLLTNMACVNHLSTVYFTCIMYVYIYLLYIWITFLFFDITTVKRNWEIHQIYYIIRSSFSFQLKFIQSWIRHCSNYFSITELAEINVVSWRLYLLDQKGKSRSSLTKGLKLIYHRFNYLILYSYLWIWSSV